MTKDLIWINDGTTNRRVSQHDAEIAQQNGWVLGRTKLGVSPKLRSFLDGALNRAGKLKKYGYTDEVVAAERAAGNKWCSWHKKFEPSDTFGQGKTVRLICKDAWMERSKSRVYNVPRNWYDIKLIEQGGHCALCPAVTSRAGKKKDSRLCIDHDHKCCNEGAKSCGKCVRGLLCHACNQRLGYFEQFLEALDGSYKLKTNSWESRAWLYLAKFK